MEEAHANNMANTLILIGAYAFAVWPATEGHRSEMVKTFDRNDHNENELQQQKQT